MDKKNLRQQMLEARDKLEPLKALNRSSRIIERLLGLDIYAEAGTIMVYLDFRNEVNTDRLIKKALEDGKKITVPVVNPSEKTMTAWQLVNYPGDLVSGPYGILEPLRTTSIPVSSEEIDLVIIPGVAFDPRGNRLGYGGGYYDRFLPGIRPSAVTAALAYEMQIMYDLSQYMGPHDFRVQYILTEKRIIRVH